MLIFWTWFSMCIFLYPSTLQLLQNKAHLFLELLILLGQLCHVSLVFSKLFFQLLNYSLILLLFLLLSILTFLIAWHQFISLGFNFYLMLIDGQKFLYFLDRRRSRFDYIWSLSIRWRRALFFTTVKQCFCLLHHDFLCFIIAFFYC